MALKLLSSIRCFGGEQRRYQGSSNALASDTVFSVFMPAVSASASVPVLYYLSGLTCTDENAVTKAGAQRVANELGIAIVFPDTSPRGEGVADDPDGAYDLGLGAGFYLNATREPWAAHYRMEEYITEELPGWLAEIDELDVSCSSLSGHSMGGHGAMTLALKNPGTYRSVSAFSPICAPASCPWGHKAFTAYLGSDESEWKAHDTAELILAGARQIPVLIDQGGADGFLDEQLKPELLLAACNQTGFEVEYREQAGYDHSYYFIASFIEDHLRFHHRHLSA